MTGQAWQIRRARPADAAAIAHCIDAAYQPYRTRIADLPAVSEGILEDIRDNIVWVAGDRSIIAGALILVAHKASALLANVAVDPAYSGQGIGRRLIDQAECYCIDQGLPELRLSTHIDMPDNVRLYAHLGWIETGRAGNKVQMSKRLS